MFRISYVFLILMSILSCGDSKEESEKPTSPRVKKFTSISTPKQNQVFIRGSEINIQIKTDNDFGIDSVEIVVGEETSVFTDTDFSITLPGKKVGTWRLRFKVYGNSTSETHYRKIIVLQEDPPDELSYTVVNSYPHDTEDYTQGLLIKDGFLYESTGQRGQSTFKKKDITSGETLKVVNLPNDLFGEGLAIYNDEFYQLTWTSGKGFVYNMNMEETRSFNYQVQGWGLATFNDYLILTDGSEKIYFVEPRSFTIEKQLEVYDDQRKVEALNELEVIDGLIYANVYQEDFVLIIDPLTGEVLQRIDLSGILPIEESRGADVLNGIAHDPKTGKIYVTGKLWPKIYEVTFQPKTIQ